MDEPFVLVKAYAVKANDVRVCQSHEQCDFFLGQFYGMRHNRFVLEENKTEPAITR